jgi:hypothetical protein
VIGGLGGSEVVFCGLLVVPIGAALTVAAVQGMRRRRRLEAIRPADPETARWLPDPFGRHEVRYWDGARWTSQVANAGVTGTDPPIDL